MSRYDVNAANVNRIIRFRVEAANAADRDTGLFLALKGPSSDYPHYGQVTGTPTANQELAQLRLSLVVRALSAYTVPVFVEVATDSAGTGVGSAVVIGFEADRFGAYFNQAWTTNQGLAKHLVTDIVDQLGQPGAAKTKAGLQSLLDSLATVSYDGGTTGPFGDLSSSGAIVLPDGRTTAGAPVLDNNGGGVADAGLAVAYIGF